MLEQVAAAAMKKMGRLERFASSFAVSQVVYHITPGSPTGCGDAPMSVGRPFWECPNVGASAMRARSGIVIFIGRIRVDTFVNHGPLKKFREIGEVFKQ